MNPEIGMMLDGFCGGEFGRDSYADKRVEAFGDDWIVAREQSEDAEPVFACLSDREARDQFIA
jgi:hypothetical protein